MRFKPQQNKPSILNALINTGSKKMEPQRMHTEQLHHTIGQKNENTKGHSESNP